MTTSKIDNSSEYQIIPWEQVDISNHYMFRLVMENPDLCQIALERILGIKITKLEVLVAEKSIEHKYSSRGIRLDIYAEDDAGIAYDFEMQATDRDKSALGKRTRYYQSLLDGDALKKNTPYAKLRKSYVIFICKFDPFDRNFSYYTFNSWCDEDKSLNLGDSTTKILLNTKGDKTGMSKELKAFLEYIDTNSPTDEYTKWLANTVQTIKKDEGARNLYMTLEQQRMEDIAYAEKKVREELQPYIAAAKQEAEIAKQEAADADKRAKAAQQEADIAKQKNIANIISICKEANFSREQIIHQLMEKIPLSFEEASKIFAEH